MMTRPKALGKAGLKLFGGSCCALTAYVTAAITPGHSTVSMIYIAGMVVSSTILVGSALEDLTIVVYGKQKIED